MKPADVRESLRPHGRVAPGCANCLHFADCGGIEPELGLFNTECVLANCCNPPSLGEETIVVDCDNVCPRNPKYLELLQEVGGNLWFNDLPTVSQSAVELPLYIPLIHHASKRNQLLDWPTVALDTYQIVGLKSNRMETVEGSADSLRERFGLSHSSTVVLRGVADDRPLERYWTYRRRDGVPQQLARLGVTLAVGPNFSHFLDVPRHDNLFNRKRQLLCLGEFVEAGLNLAPHLNAAQPGDWRYWGKFLGDNPSITVVAIEFETGNRSRSQGQRVLTELVALQQRVGRSLHPLVIGGTQFLEAIAKEFRAASFIDSTPFMKAMYRQSFVDLGSTGKCRWKRAPTAPGEPLDKLLVQNLRCYSDWLDRRWTTVAGEVIKFPPPRKSLAMATG